MYRRETRALLRHYLVQRVSNAELAKRSKSAAARSRPGSWTETSIISRLATRLRPLAATRLDPYSPLSEKAARFRPSSALRNDAEESAPVTRPLTVPTSKVDVTSM
jgi:hypothetical protein